MLAVQGAPAGRLRSLTPFVLLSCSGRAPPAPASRGPPGRGRRPHGAAAARGRSGRRSASVAHGGIFQTVPEVSAASFPPAAGEQQTAASIVVMFVCLSNKRRLVGSPEDALTSE